MTRREIEEAIDILGACYRQASLSIGSWRCYFWRQGQPPSTASQYPAPYHVHPAEYMAEHYHTARYALLAMLAS